MQKTVVFLLLAVCVGRARSEAPQQVDGAAMQISHIAGGVELTAGHVRLRVTAVSDSVIRVRATQKTTFPPDSSWAVIQQPDQASRLRPARPKIRVTSSTV